MINIKTSFEKIIKDYDYQKYDEIWNIQSKKFKEFWESVISEDSIKSNESDYDPIIRMLDRNAKGFNSEIDRAVAKTFIRQSTWYRTFNDFNDKSELRDIMNKIFHSVDDKTLIKNINELEMINAKNKNGLTGKNAVVLNALLFLNNPTYFISSVSLNHRRQIIDFFGFQKLKYNYSYGENVVYSNRSIISGFSEILFDNWSPRTLAYYIYHPSIKSYWTLNQDNEEESEQVDTDETKDSLFQLEKHFEDFLVTNWETTTLGKEYDLIVEDGELVSQQYDTKSIGKIDLLVKSKNENGYVVIELKRSQTSDQTIGQITRYMGWVKKNLKNANDVKGIIIAPGFDPKLKYSLEMLENIKLLQFKVNFSLVDVSQ